MGAPVVSGWRVCACVCDRWPGRVAFEHQFRAFPWSEVLEVRFFFVCVCVRGGGGRTKRATVARCAGAVGLWTRIGELKYTRAEYFFLFFSRNEE